ncbi:helix-turn-helix domain-containing protein [Flavitalea flava]
MIKIENKQQYYSAMAEIESYLQKGFANLSVTEDNHLAELSNAVEVWEMKEYPMPMNPSFVDILLYIMQQKHISQSDLSANLSVSKSLISEIINGNKQPNIDVVINLYNKFNIDARIILDSINLQQPKMEKTKGFATRYGKNPPSKYSY